MGQSDSDIFSNRSIYSVFMLSFEYVVLSRVDLFWGFSFSTSVGSPVFSLCYHIRW